MLRFFFTTKNKFVPTAKAAAANTTEIGKPFVTSATAEIPPPVIGNKTFAPEILTAVTSS